jgi:glucan phosphoethanolaminetransferase (alkaline phosphatase superfamily)
MYILNEIKEIINSVGRDFINIFKFVKSPINWLIILFSLIVFIICISFFIFSNESTVASITCPTSANMKVLSIIVFGFSFMLLSIFSLGSLLNIVENIKSKRKQSRSDIILPIICTAFGIASYVIFKMTC